MEDIEFEHKIAAYTKATWGGRRRKRSMMPTGPLSILHCEIGAINHDNMRKMGEADVLCAGEFIDMLIEKEVARRIAKGATGLNPAKSCIRTPNSL